MLVVDGGRIVEDGPPQQLAAQDSHYRRLLQAEQALREQLWGSAAWRRLRLQGGQLLKTPPESATSPAADGGATPPAAGGGAAPSASGGTTA